MMPTETNVEWITIDIETISGSPEDAERYIRDRWQPDAIATWSEMTIGKRAKEALAKKKERLALLTAAPIICVSYRTPSSLGVFHWMDKATLPEVQAHGASDQQAMMLQLRDFMNAVIGPETVIVGHNIEGFDLPMLRNAFLTSGVQLPYCLQIARPNVYDIMKVYTRSFEVGGGLFVALQEVLERFGVDSHKNLVSGADVQEMYEGGQHDAILKYAMLDVMAESELFLRMTGRSNNLQ